MSSLSLFSVLLISISLYLAFSNVFFNNEFSSNRFLKVHSFSFSKASYFSLYFLTSVSRLSFYCSRVSTIYESLFNSILLHYIWPINSSLSSISFSYSALDTVLLSYISVSAAVRILSMNSAFRPLLIGVRAFNKSSCSRIRGLNSGSSCKMLMTLENSLLFAPAYSKLATISPSCWSGLYYYYDIYYWSPSLLVYDLKIWGLMGPFELKRLGLYWTIPTTWPERGIIMFWPLIPAMSLS